MPSEASKAKSKSKPRLTPTAPAKSNASRTHERGAHISDHGDETTPTLPRTLPCATVIQDEPACSYYQFGNSIPNNLFMHLDVFAPAGLLTTIDALLVGSGDLQNVLHTLAHPGSHCAQSSLVRSDTRLPSTRPSPNSGEHKCKLASTAPTPTGSRRPGLRRLGKSAGLRALSSTGPWPTIAKSVCEHFSATLAMTGDQADSEPRNWYSTFGGSILRW
ncbi:hypothetical protein BCR44DRAFT_1509387 [Catenaria anguillulae PL171]|uniref:Uncharacterized protein n=1 Tax=Catenaria anguillulae PL171 TaxID=765915 RepID=A0A1Y2I4F6_9FUNG|nr:hypothetical protein BCR44DRAFT_1509387 [Catenaria anguillulae PL171]